jgi:FkbM family methyltransferase
MADDDLSCSIWSLAKFYRRRGLDLLQRALGSDRVNYLMLRPPCSREQAVLNTRTRRPYTFEIRDATDMSVLRQIFVHEDYNLSRLARSSDLLGRYEQISQARRTPLILDCGANIGLSAAYFADVFPAARVVAIEPEEGNCRLARRNCSAANVEIVRAAIASEDKAGVLVDPGLGAWGYRVEECPEGSVKLMSINGILSDPANVGCEPFIVKIDIEGFEKELFSKNTEWIDRFMLLIIELHDWMLPRERTSGTFLSAIAGLDRDFVHIGENVFSISNRQ